MLTSHPAPSTTKSTSSRAERCWLGGWQHPLLAEGRGCEQREASKLPDPLAGGRESGRCAPISSCPQLIISSSGRMVSKTQVSGRPTAGVGAGSKQMTSFGAPVGPVHRSPTECQRTTQCGPTTCIKSTARQGSKVLSTASGPTPHHAAVIDADAIWPDRVPDDLADYINRVEVHSIPEPAEQGVAAMGLVVVRGLLLVQFLQVQAVRALSKGRGRGLAPVKVQQPGQCHPVMQGLFVQC